MRRERLRDWMDARTGYRTMARHLLDEPIVSGVGWWFVSGSVLLALLVVQLVTGLVLAVYYVPSPELAYESVRFVTNRLPFGGIVRGLHVFGASFIVIAALIHMLRVVLFGAYKAPRELTWISGVLLWLVILAFALSGYLLPWDQKAYWATTVTINIARSVPVAGDVLASVLRGGPSLGALTLGRWYAAHVLILPGALLALVLAHLYLMRRHGIAGPVTPRAGAAKPFYPYQALKDTVAFSIVFALLLALAVAVPASLEPAADPMDSRYVPRPEWYFLSLFQLLKYFPGSLEPVATVVIPGALVALLVLLPLFDRRPERRPLRRPMVTGSFAVAGLGVAALTWAGLRDAPRNADPHVWGPLSTAGLELTRREQCARCHTAGGVAGEMERMRLRRDADWIVNHVQDPEVVGPGIRPPPPGALSGEGAAAVIAYLRKIQAGVAPPAASDGVLLASMVFATRCAGCHAIDGEGDPQIGADLSRVGSRHGAAWLRSWIADPRAIDPATEMPSFRDSLAEEEMAAIVSYLAARK